MKLPFDFSMKRFSILLPIIIFVILQSCNKHDPMPDYASKLEGTFDIGYLMIDLTTKEAVSAKLGASKFARIALKRKRNQYLTATVTIDDSTTRFTDTFELAVFEGENQTEEFGKPGFLHKYKVGSQTSTALFLSHWSLYEDGSIMGMIQSGDEKMIRIFSLGSDIKQ